MSLKKNLILILFALSVLLSCKKEQSEGDLDPGKQVENRIAMSLAYGIDYSGTSPTPGEPYERDWSYIFLGNYNDSYNAAEGDLLNHSDSRDQLNSLIQTWHMSVNRRGAPTASDTIQLRISDVTQPAAITGQSYRLRFVIGKWPSDISIQLLDRETSKVQDIQNGSYTHFNFTQLNYGAPTSFAPYSDRFALILTRK